MSRPLQNKSRILPALVMLLVALAPLPAVALPAEPSAAEQPAASLSLEQALDRVYREHPELWRLRQEQRIWAARERQAGLGPNPELSLIGEDFAGSAAFTSDRFTQFTLELAQALPLSDRIERSRQLARLNQQLAYWDYRVRLQELGAEVYSAYARLQNLQARQHLAAELIQGAQAMHSLLERAVSAGKLAPPVLLQSELELQSARAEAARLELARQGELRNLALLWGGAEAPSGMLSSGPPQIPSLPVLRERLVSHPRLARWETEKAQRAAALAAAQAQSSPDLTIAGGLRYHPPLDWGAVLILGMPLALNHANQGQIEEARLRQELWERERELEARQLLGRLTTAYGQLQAHQDLLGILNQQVILANEQQQVAYKAFDAGKTGYLEVLTAWRNGVQLRRQLAEAQGDLLLAQIEILTASRIVFPQESLDPVNESPP